MMNKRFWIYAVIGLLMTSCATHSGPSKQEKREQFSALKTQLAIQYMEVKDYRSSIAAINEALNTTPDNEIALMVKAVIYQKLKINDTADESYRRALAINPSSAEINNNYGWFLCDSLNRPQQAKAYFARALQDPTYPTPHLAHMNKGICAARVQDWAMAESSLARARALAPDFPPVLKELARLRMMEGYTAEAQAFFNDYQGQVDLLDADGLYLGWQLAQAQKMNQAAYEYAVQLKNRFPASEEVQKLQNSH